VFYTHKRRCNVNNFPHRYIKYTLYLVVVIFTLSFAQWMGNGKFLKTGIAEAKITKGTIGLNKANPKVKKAMAVQDSHTPDLMALPEVVGTATGLTDAGGIAILVFTENRMEAGVIPRSLEGVPVVIKVTGKILAFKKPSWAGPSGGNTSNNIDPTGQFNRPVPIGVSTGNAGECSAGTIGARVTDGSKVYALSNNHVYALENSADPVSNVLQPGLYDTNCIYDPTNDLGTLSDFVEINFDGTNNTVDAAIALTTTANLDNSTPSDGYLIPKSTTISAEINQNVQKYGRTTSLTKGTVTGINATVNVGYSSGTALFVDQIVVSGNKGPFIKAGDSGSLLVTDPGKNPVGLLFAGNSSGKTAIANPIDYVLTALHVDIDGE
jgi:hypothetical protein